MPHDLPCVAHGVTKILPCLQQHTGLFELEHVDSRQDTAQGALYLGVFWVVKRGLSSELELVSLLVSLPSWGGGTQVPTPACTENGFLCGWHRGRPFPGCEAIPCLSNASGHRGGGGIARLCVGNSSQCFRVRLGSLETHSSSLFSSAVSAQLSSLRPPLPSRLPLPLLSRLSLLSRFSLLSPSTTSTSPQSLSGSRQMQTLSHPWALWRPTDGALTECRKCRMSGTWMSCSMLCSRHATGSAS
jgi:hypothetical protein